MLPTFSVLGFHSRPEALEPLHDPKLSRIRFNAVDQCVRQFVENGGQALSFLAGINARQIIELGFAAKSPKFLEPPGFRQTLLRPVGS